MTCICLGSVVSDGCKSGRLELKSELAVSCLGLVGVMCIFNNIHVGAGGICE